MKIAIFGSYFDPPHLGHQLVAQMVLDYGHFDSLWFLPGNKSTFGKQPILAKHRLKMIGMIKMPFTAVSTLEIDHDLDGNTINLIPLLQKYYPRKKFTFVIGSDQLPDFHKWGRYKDLLRQMEFLVVPRAGYPVEPVYAGMRVLKHPGLVITNISSTIVRERVKNKLAITHLVTKEVEEYIGKNKLYKNSKP